MGQTKTYYMEAPELAILERWAKALDRSRSWVLRELIVLGNLELEKEWKEKGQGS